MTESGSSGLVISGVSCVICQIPEVLNRLFQKTIKLKALLYVL
jgi:hypothetical protein